jgi:hypothetical protein
MDQSTFESWEMIIRENQKNSQKDHSDSNMNNMSASDVWEMINRENDAKTLMRTSHIDNFIIDIGGEQIIAYPSVTKLRLFFICLVLLQILVFIIFIS